MPDMESRQRAGRGSAELGLSPLTSEERISSMANTLRSAYDKRLSRVTAPELLIVRISWRLLLHYNAIRNRHSNVIGALLHLGTLS